jgi:hypothetical protein
VTACHKKGTLESKKIRDNQMKDSNEIRIRITITPPRASVSETSTFLYKELMSNIVRERLTLLTGIMFETKADSMTKGYIRSMSATTTVEEPKQPMDSAVWDIVHDILRTICDTAIGIRSYRVIIEYWWTGNDNKHVLSGTSHQLTKTNPKFSLTLKPLTKKDKELM